MTVDNLREGLGYAQGDKEVMFEGKVVVGIAEKDRTVELIYGPIFAEVKPPTSDQESQVK